MKNGRMKYCFNFWSMLPCVEVVPAGVVEIVRLQREDFAYIKP